MRRICPDVNLMPRKTAARWNPRKDLGIPWCLTSLSEFVALFAQSRVSLRASTAKLYADPISHRSCKAQWTTQYPTLPYLIGNPLHELHSGTLVVDIARYAFSSCQLDLHESLGIAAI